MRTIKALIRLSGLAIEYVYSLCMVKGIKWTLRRLGYSERTLDWYEKKFQERNKQQ